MVPAKKKTQKNKNIFNKAKIDKKALENIVLEIKTQEKKTKKPWQWILGFMDCGG